MQFAVELYDISEDQKKIVENLLSSYDPETTLQSEIEETLYMTFKQWQNEQQGLNLVNPKQERCGMCNIKNMCFEWAKWHVLNLWPKRK